MIPDRLNRKTAERLLDDPVGVTHTGGHPVAPLLVAARAAPQSREFDGEKAALVAFRHASARAAGERSDVDPPPVHAVSGRGFGRLGVRAGLAVLVLATTGGVAMAATGSLPGTRPAPPITVPASSAPTTTAPPPGRSTGSVSSTGPGTTERPGSRSGLPDLCRAYRADHGPGHALSGPDLATLVAAAGGRSRVPGYCDRVLADDGLRATSSPGHGEPSSKPDARQGTPPTAPPGRPTGPGDRTRPADVGEHAATRRTTH
ncbi:hypothetical protein [Micromonospora musae]|uniref:hypothetical protein n=1 Tax=Micromonospora musae TaxID=1894970 RepID=UPI0033F29797